MKNTTWNGSIWNASSVLDTGNYNLDVKIEWISILFFEANG
jgi:hypothetical protein